MKKEITRYKILEWKKIIGFPEHEIIYGDIYLKHYR